MLRWIVLAALLLAGCTSPPADEPEPQPTLNVVSDPTDYGYLDQDTDGSGFHIHDYWGGQDTLLLLDATQECLSCTRSVGGSDSDVLMEMFRPEGGDVVPQGAANMSLVVSWSVNEADSDFTSVHLSLKRATNATAAYYGQLQNGVPLTIAIAPDEADPPHMQLSAWEFYVMARDDSGDESTAVADWSVRLQATVERGHDIEPWPPHPDHWQGATELTLIDVAVDSAYDVALPFTHMCSGACFDQWLPVLDGIIVPADADRIEVVLEHGQDIPIPFALWYHGGDTWTMSAATTDLVQNGAVTFVIDVDRDVADSPYAQQSVWEFFVEPAVDRPYAYTGDYTATATVIR